MLSRKFYLSFSFFISDNVFSIAHDESIGMRKRMGAYRMMP